MLSSKNIDLPFRVFCLCIILFFSLGCHSDNSLKESMTEYQKEKEEVMQKMSVLEQDMKARDYASLVFPVPPEEHRIDNDFVYTAELLDEKTLDSLSLQKKIRLTVIKKPLHDSNEHRIIWAKTIIVKNYQSSASHGKIPHEVKKVQDDTKRFDILLQRR